MKTDSDVQTTVFSGPGLTLCRFSCPGNHDRWRRENRIVDGHNIAFAEVPVEISHADHPPILAEPSVAVAYNHGDPFRRRQLHPVGDRGNIFLFDSETLLQALAPFDAEADPERPLAICVSPVGSKTYLKQRLLIAAVESRESPDDDWVLEQALEILGEVLAAGYRDREVRPSSDERCRERVEAVKDRLARNWHQPLSLAELAAEVGVSTFHLCRSFKRSTGMTLHSYRQCLRLRTGLVRLEQGETSLADLSLDLGFSHQSHFTEMFRRAFGEPPGKVSRAFRSYRASTRRFSSRI